MQTKRNYTMNARSGIAATLVVAALAYTVAASALDPAPAPPAGRRTEIFISDMHLGVGHQSQDAQSAWTAGDWHPMEDFRWHSEFDRFLSAIEARVKASGTSADLVILGDMFELWQTPSKSLDCIYDRAGKAIPPDKIDEAERRGEIQADLSCTEADAFKRATRVLGAHQTTLDSIRSFAEQADNRVAIVPGNHDASLVFASVEQLVLQRIGAPAERVRVAREGYWQSADGQIFGEHGHFIEGDINAYDSEPASCLDVAGRPASCREPKPVGPFLKRPTGEQFVQRFYNQYEEQYSIIDNITNELYGVKIASSEEGTSVVVRALKQGFRFLFFQESMAQFGSLLGAEGEENNTLGQGDPKLGWDAEAVRKKGDLYLAQSLYPDDPIRKPMEQAIASGELKLGIEKLTNAEIDELCNLRYVRRAEQVAGRRPSPLIEECPGAITLGALVTNLLTNAAQRKSKRLDAVRATLPDGQRPTKEFGVYVYAHTHAAHGPCRPKELLARSSSKPAAWNPTIINTGAWQRLATPAGLDAMRKAEPGKRLSDFTPEGLPACYSAVIVPAYQQSHDGKSATLPQPTLWFWRQKENGDWDFDQKCEQDPGRVPVDGCAG